MRAQQTATDSTKTHLAIITETWPPEVNGVARTIYQLVHGLHQRGDYRIELVRPQQQTHEQAIYKPDYQEYFVKGLTLLFYREVRLGFPQYYVLKQRWQKERPDIVQIVTEGPLGYSALRAARALGIPVISDFHTNFDQYSRYYHASLLFRLARRYLRHLHNQTLITLVPTRELQQQLAANGYEKLGILDRGIDIKLFNPMRRNEKLRTRLGIRPEQLLVILVTRMAQEKNLDLAFQAFNAIQAIVPDARFLLVGDGPERKRLQALHPDALFVGVQTGTTLAEHYASGDLFLYPSTSETFGNVIIEAMASGLPVVTFDYAAAREYIRHGDNGITVPLYENAAFIAASVALAQDSALRSLMRKRAYQTVKPISWDGVVQRLDRILHEILSSNPNQDLRRNVNMLTSSPP